MGQAGGNPIGNAGYRRIFLQRLLFLAVNYPLIAPVSQVVHRRAPAYIIQQAKFISSVLVMTAVNIDAIAKYARFSIGYMFPLRQIGIKGQLFHRCSSLSRFCLLIPSQRQRQCL